MSPAPVPGSAAVAALARALADPSRCALCLAMLDGRTWTLTDLAAVAGVSVPTASEHATHLVGAGLVAEERVGRHRHLRLAGPEVAALLEHLAAVSGPPAAAAPSLRAVSQRQRLARARTCYDHLAGRLGVAVTEALLARRVLSRRSGLAVTVDGERWFDDLGVDLPGLRAGRRLLVRDCLDWTERRPHLAGALGAGLCTAFVDRGWVRRPDRTRRLEVTAPGFRELEDRLGLTAADLEPSVPGT